MKIFAKLKQFLAGRFAQLEQIRDGPRAVAGGVAIGTFWGFTPLLGLKTLFSIVFAWLFRCSKLSAVIAVSLQDILTPVWPVVLRWEYDLGFWILSQPHHFPGRFELHEAHLRYLLRLSTLEFIWPTFVGSLLFALPSAVAIYWILLPVLERYNLLRKRRATHPASGQG